MQGLVLVAGEGTRLRPLTLTIPKSLIPVMGKPLVEYILEHLKLSGITDICLVIGYLGKLFQDLLEDGSRLGVKISYVTQCERLGIAHAIHRAIEEGIVRREFIAYLGDNYFEEGISRFVKKFKESDNDVYIVLTVHRDPSRFGCVIIEDGKVKRLIEKPKNPPPNSYVLTGLYMFRDPDLVEKAFRDLKPSARGEYEITDLIQWFIDRGYSVGFDITNGWWKDTGTPDDMLELVHMLLDNINTRIEGEVKGKVVGRVIIEKGAIVEGEVYGPAYIGKNAHIHKNAKIEHYVDVEEKCEIISGLFSRSLILPEAHIEAGNARIVDSIIGRKTNVRLCSGQYKIITSDFTIIYNS